MMYPHLLKIQMVLMSLVAIGGFVLGSSIGDLVLAVFSIVGALAGFLVVDRWKGFDLSGWSANVVLIFILLYSMRDFIGGGSTAKLVAVAHLLVYLQIALFFQKKTPRLGWQILVLSILQMVLAAIFNLNFEYGVFFILFFVALTVAMIIQFDFSEWSKTRSANLANRKRAMSQQDSSVAYQLREAVVLSKPQSNRNLIAMTKLAFPWIAVSLVFAFILFHSLPHSAQEWRGVAKADFIGTGKSRSVEIAPDGMVPISGSLVFRASFKDISDGRDVVLQSNPYFRGMAFNRWLIKDGITHWEAPYDHVFEWSYLRLPHVRESNYTNSSKLLQQTVTLEPTIDPLLFSVRPEFRTNDSDTEIEFCRDISALTRRRADRADNIASFKYDVAVVVDDDYEQLMGWPYVSFKFGEEFPGMEVGSPEHVLLTEMDPARYPLLVELAQQISDANPNSDRMDLCNAMVRHFSPSNRYRYTLNYSGVNRKKDLDPIEDFVANHRVGHCALYASALTLMLRSQGIPSRYVIGFHGGNFNNLTDSYVVYGRHAHAWVEAYIPAEQCTKEMFDQGIAGSGGAWLTLDATPPTNDRDSSEALDLARSIWQDYVISPDQNKQSFSRTNRLLMASTRDSDVARVYDYFVQEIQNNQAMQIGFGLVASLFIFWITWFRSGYKKRKTKSTWRERKPIRRVLAQAARLLSPDLANWISGTRSVTVPFYQRYETIIQHHFGLGRPAHQTQKEFATVVENRIAEQFSENPISNELSSIVHQIVHAFYTIAESSC
ncbi:MAG: DUF3488 and transglutaminase-like domain-containing protein, partial [Planctomycetota bacterium]